MNECLKRPWIQIENRCDCCVDTFKKGKKK